MQLGNRASSVISRLALLAGAAFLGLGPEARSQAVIVSVQWSANCAVITVSGTCNVATGAVGLMRNACPGGIVLGASACVNGFWAVSYLAGAAPAGTTLFAKPVLAGCSAAKVVPACPVPFVPPGRNFLPMNNGGNAAAAAPGQKTSGANPNLNNRCTGSNKQYGSKSGPLPFGTGLDLTGWQLASSITSPAQLWGTPLFFWLRDCGNT